MTKQEMIAREINKDPLRYLNMKIEDVREEIGKKLQCSFEENKWNNNDSVVYGTLLCAFNEVLK